MSVLIYALIDPRSHAVRYIGKANHAAKRFKTHLSDSRMRVTPVALWVRELLSQGLLPVMEIVRTVETERWPDAEKAEIGARAGLLNVAKGGNAPGQNAEALKRSGRSAAIKRVSTPFRRRLYEMKRATGSLIRWAQKTGRGSSPSIMRLRAAMRYAASKRPNEFPGWTNA